MADTHRLHIVLIGSGNVATHLGQALHRSRDYPVVQVFSRNISHARALGTKLDSPATDQYAELNTKANIYLVAVQDDALAPVIDQLKSVLPSSAFVVHTAGSIGTEALSPYFKNHGVLYPLQTFTKTKKMSYTKIPILICASSKKNSDLLHTLASSISSEVIAVTDEVRGYIHLAAVMVNNFPNYLYLMAFKWLQSKNVDFSILLPLIEETVSKIKIMSPAVAQTGPARRKDYKVLAKHVALLKNSPPDWQKVYGILTKAIQNEFD